MVNRDIKRGGNLYQDRINMTLINAGKELKDMNEQIWTPSQHIFKNINLFAEQDKHLSKVNTTTQIVVQVRLMLMKKLNLSDHIT